MITLNTIAKYKRFLEKELSAQERAICVSLVRKTNGNEFNVKNVVKHVRMQQTNQLHTILGRLVKKGVLLKTGRSKYCFKNPELVEHIEYRCSRRGCSKI